MRSIISFFLILFALTGPLMAKSETQIYGYVEKVTLVDKNLTLSAKLDTGAKTSSLSATNIQQIEVNGVPYLRFTVQSKSESAEFQAEYVGKVKIKVRANETSPDIVKSPPIRRPVVLLKIKLGDKLKTIQVNLTNRKHFLYPLLLGREAIIDFNGAVDPAKTFTVSSQGNSKQ